MDGFTRTLLQQDYITMMLKIQKCITPDFNLEECRKTALIDWVHDTASHQDHIVASEAARKTTELHGTAQPKNGEKEKEHLPDSHYDEPSEEMSYEEFHRSIFELVDVWSNEVTATAYAVLLQKIECLLMKSLKVRACASCL